MYLPQTNSLMFLFSPPISLLQCLDEHGDVDPMKYLQYVTAHQFEYDQMLKLAMVAVLLESEAAEE